MRGVGEASAAITVVNALSTGIGCAIGIRLSARAEATVTGGVAGGPVLAIDPPASRTPLVVGALTAAVERFLPSADVRVALELTSDIPVAVGLKSSSAVTSAVFLALAHAAGAAPPATEVARLSAQVSRRSGTSATGAFDDALAGLTGGVVVTNNYTDEMIRRAPLEPDLEVALWIPPGAHPPSSGVRARFASDEPIAAQAAEAAIRGEWWTAMELNSELVERAMGYPYRPIREAVARAGARSSGASGLGPAFAAVVPHDRVEAVLAQFPRDSGERRSLGFTPPIDEIGARSR